MGSKTYKNDRGEEFTTEFPAVQRFIEDMIEAGLSWRTYSGRGMYGIESAGVNVGGRTDVDPAEVYRATKIRLKQDSMGLGQMLYVHNVNQKVPK